MNSEAINKSGRIESIDILRGIIMVIMALDHVRDYFHYQSILGNPEDLETTTPFLFFTRFITHYCAPVFVFLSGTSAFLYGRNKSKKELFTFLFTRGIWLILLELFVNSLIWTFDITYSFRVVQVIWAIGISMICLSLFIYLPKKGILVLGLLLVFGHNLLDSVVMEGESIGSILWYALHQRKFMLIGPDRMFVFMYPLIPWMGVMALGYLFGQWYTKGFDPALRKKYLIRTGLSCLGIFLVLRGFNLYGDVQEWSTQDTLTKTILSFFKVTKYPPSLQFLCITLGPAFLLLAGIERMKNKISDFFLVFGRVPLFYYFLHMIVIHGLAVLIMYLTGQEWQNMILDAETVMSGRLMEYGYSLSIVYLVWVSVIALLYFPCLMYMKYKAENKDKWWLSYL